MLPKAGLLRSFLKCTALSRRLLRGAVWKKPRIECEHHTPPPVTQFSDAEIMLRLSVKQFAEDIIKPVMRTMDERRQMDTDIIRGMFANGFMGVEVPERYGGPGASFFDVIIIVEELAKIDPSVAVFCDVQNTLITPLILLHGTELQKEKYLKHTHDDWIGAFCLSEASSGSDAFAMKTVARKDDDDYIITGNKLWITSAKEANFFIVFANADPSRGYKGITAFLVDRNQDGVSVGPSEVKLGIRASSCCPVHFDSVRVNKKMLLGEFGKGYKLAIECLNGGRIGIGAQMVGLAQGCFDEAIPYLQERKQFGQRIIDFQGMQHQVAEIATQIEAARLLVYNAARFYESKIDFVKEAAMAKWYSSVVATATTSKCIEWLGGIGFTTHSIVEKFYRDCKIGTSFITEKCPYPEIFLFDIDDDLFKNLPSTMMTSSSFYHLIDFLKSLDQGSQKI